MEFVNPGFLYGLLAVSIPVIIHLFNFRRFKKVYFTNVALIKELKEQTQKQSKLKHLLILLMRILAIIAIVFAFARPFIPVNQNLINPEEISSISVFVDNSFSMQADSDKGTLLDAAKEKAREIVSVFKSSDRFQLLTHDFEGRHQRFYTKDEFNNLLDEVKISPASRNLSQIVLRQEELLSDEPSAVKASFIISDYQKSFINDNPVLADSGMSFYFLPINAYFTNNLYIDSCWFETPVAQVNQAMDLFVRIKNNSDKNYEKIPLKLQINKLQKAIASFNIEPGSETITKLSFTNNSPGIQQAKLEITDYPVVFDDAYYFSFEVAAQFDILCINGDQENKYLNALFKDDTLFQYVNIGERYLDFSTLPGYQLIVLNEIEKMSSGLIQELARFMEGGGNLVIVPAPEIDIDSYNAMMAALGGGDVIGKDTVDQQIDYINAEHALYRDVFEKIPENINLPRASYYYIYENQTRSTYQKLLGLQNNHPFLASQKLGNGVFYYFASPFNSSAGNFTQHAIFVPTLYKIAISSFSARILSYTIGENEGIRLDQKQPEQDPVLTITDAEKTMETIPGHRQTGSFLELYVYDQINKAGNYFINRDEKPIKGVSFNYSRAESVLDFYSEDELTTLLADSGQPQFKVFESQNRPIVSALTEMSQGITLWKWFVLAALLFLLLEILLLRFWTP